MTSDGDDEVPSDPEALHWAAERGDLAEVRALVQAGADPTIPGWMQLTALHQAEARQGPLGPEMLALLKSFVVRNHTLRVTSPRRR